MYKYKKEAKRLLSWYIILCSLAFSGLCGTETFDCVQHGLTGGLTQRGQNCFIIAFQFLHTVILQDWTYPVSPSSLFDFKFQVFPDCQDRKTNSFVHFLGEVTARQF